MPRTIKNNLEKHRQAKGNQETQRNAWEIKKNIEVLRRNKKSNKLKEHKEMQRKTKNS